MLIDALVLLLFMVISLIFWGYFVFQAKKAKQPIPKAYLLFLPGVVLVSSSLTCSLGELDIAFRVSFLSVLIFIYIKRNELSSFFISTQNLPKNIIAGVFIGLGFALFTTVAKRYGYDFTSLSDYIERPLLVVLINSIQIAIYEEVWFRGVLMGYLRKYNFRGLAILAQGLFFVFLHIPRYVRSGELAVLIPVGLFGLVIGYITWRHNNLTGGIFAHFIYNIWAWFLYVNC